MSGENGVELQVLEPAPGGGWIGAGSSGFATDEHGGANATNLSIGAGDLIGADVHGGDSNIGYSPAPGGEFLVWDPALDEGGGGSPAAVESGHRLSLSAEVELTPVVTSVSPASGSTTGANTVAITGKYLSGATNVVFGAKPATSFSVDLSGEHITAIAPPSSSSTVDVSVSNLRSSSNPVPGDKYTFVAPVPIGPPRAPTTTTTTTGSGGPSPANAELAVSAFSESASRWRLGRSLPHISTVSLGTTFSFVLNRPANVALSFTHIVAGRRTSGKCVASSHKNATRPKCRRTVTVGSLTVPGHAGLNDVRFQGRLSSSKRLTPGGYGVSVTTHDNHGLKVLTRSLRFTALP